MLPPQGATCCHGRPLVVCISSTRSGPEAGQIELRAWGVRLGVARARQARCRTPESLVSLRRASGWEGEGTDRWIDRWTDRRTDGRRSVLGAKQSLRWHPPVDGIRLSMASACRWHPPVGLLPPISHAPVLQVDMMEHVVASGSIQLNPARPCHPMWGHPCCPCLLHCLGYWVVTSRCLEQFIQAPRHTHDAI